MSELEQDFDRDIHAASRRALASVCLNLLLAVTKGVAGVLSGSAALIGDAIHSAADVLASGAALVGLWIAGKRHPSFPFGLYKAETIATLAISGAVLAAAYEIGRHALLGGDGVPDTDIALPVAILSLFIAVGFGLYQLREGRRLCSPALKADARDYLVDGISTVVVVIGLVGTRYGYALDRWAAGGVSLFVLWAGIQLLMEAVRDLLDASMPQDLVHDVTSLVEKLPQVARVLGCIGRQAGGRYIVNLDVLLRTADHRVADRIADRVEADVKNAFPRIVMVHVRTHFGHDEVKRRLTPQDQPGGKLAEGIASAPWFLLETVEGGSGVVLERAYLENPHCRSPKRRGLHVGQWLVSLRPDEVVCPAGHAGTAVVLLEEAGVTIITGGETSS